jgi:hypothetical protein
MRRSPLLCALAGLILLTPFSASADPLVMIIQDVIAYRNGIIDEKETAEWRSQEIGERVLLTFFSEEKLLRVEMAGKYQPNKQSHVVVCERTEKEMSHMRFICHSDIEGEVLTVEVTHILGYLRTGVFRSDRIVSPEVQSSLVMTAKRHDLW